MGGRQAVRGVCVFRAHRGGGVRVVLLVYCDVSGVVVWLALYHPYIFELTPLYVSLVIVVSESLPFKCDLLFDNCITAFHF